MPTKPKPATPDAMWKLAAALLLLEVETAAEVVELPVAEPLWEEVLDPDVEEAVEEVAAAAAVEEAEPEVVLVDIVDEVEEVPEVLEVELVELEELEDERRQRRNTSSPPREDDVGLHPFLLMIDMLLLIISSKFGQKDLLMDWEAVKMSV